MKTELKEIIIENLQDLNSIIKNEGSIVSITPFYKVILSHVVDDNDEILDTVMSSIKGIAGMSIHDNINPNHTFCSLGLDSLDLTEILINIERKLKLPNKDIGASFSKVKTPYELAEYIKQTYFDKK